MTTKKQRIVSRLGFNALVMICCAALLTTGTLAWLIYNREVDSANMEMTIEATPNLIISDNASAIASYTKANWTDSYIVKSWADTAQELIPTDHYDSAVYTNVTGTNRFNLVYNTNPEEVSRTTGKGNGLTFEHVPADGENLYFLDRNVYIASLDKELVRGTDYTNITFTIEEVGNGTATNTAYKAASIDVYIDGTYRGTLDLDTKDSFSVSNINAIPVNTSSSINITFRCYFNGALENASDNTKTYVNSTALSTNNADVSMTVKISAN